MTEEDDCSLAIVYWYFLRKSETRTKPKRRQKQERRFWIHEVISRRGELGEHYRLVQELRHDPEHFRRYFRMSTSQFDMLFDLIGPKIEKLDTNWRRSISPAERLAITLRSVLIKSVASFQQNLGGRPLPSHLFPSIPYPPP